MAKHTPGPWERRRNWIEQSDPFGKQIAKVKFPVSTKEAAADEAEQEEAFANARLIACAPELLDALRAVLMVSLLPCDISGARMVEEARAVLVKATGGV